MGRTSELVLGVSGGIFGILTGIFVVVVGGMGSVFGIMDAELVITLGFAAVLFGVVGIIGGAIVNKNNKIGGSIMVLSGILGFIAVSLFWIVAGVLLVLGGDLALKTK